MHFFPPQLARLYILYAVARRASLFNEDFIKAKFFAGCILGAKFVRAKTKSFYNEYHNRTDI